MICMHCGHTLAWVKQLGGSVLRVTDSHLVLDRESCVPWWNHEVFDPSVAARAILQAMNGRPRR